MQLHPHAGLRLARTIALAVPLLSLSSLAHAALVTTPDGKATINESPYGLPAISGSVSSLDLTGRTGTNNFTTNGVTLTGQNNGTNGNNPTSPIVQGSSSGLYAAPVTNASGATMTTPYLSTGANPGMITLDFATPQKYLGFLWGSIDAINTLTFSLIGGGTEVITGTQALAAATGPGSGIPGSQSFGGSQYILINLLNGLTFNKVVLSEQASSPNYPSFEAGLFQYSTANQVPLPEPTSIALVGIGAAALLIRRRKSRAGVSA